MNKSAFVTIVGRPSAGKSTLINALAGGKVAIVSPVPQTTRNTIRGIVNRDLADGDKGQLVLLDTPGLHLSDKKFNKRLDETATKAIADADIILYMLDAIRGAGPEEEAIAKRLNESLRKAGNEGKLVIALNKIDSPGARPAECKAFLAEVFRPLDPLVMEISALKGDGIDALLGCLFSLAPEAEPFYPPGYYTDQEIPFRISEVIRGQCIKRLRQELPYALYVDVADAELRGEEGRETLWIRAFIICERESQKGMIVGKGGSMIKAIRLASLKELADIFDWKLELDLRVKADPHWRHNDALLRKIIN
jgi:GTP-binding protein Era